ncbi:hypothetical protein [Aeromonas veronii]|uniref:hypothetical protein n=1 Tax=Aeromonas veronii TaxID=654 RepID=UPI000A4C2FAF|nr:hypothetical protein [Aeromonas veronii]
MFFLNDISIAASFDDEYHFKSKLDVIMKIKNMLRQHGHDTKCSSNLLHTELAKDINLYQFSATHLNKDQRNSLILWLSKGPFWEKDRVHTEDDYYSFADNLVTNTALAEAAATQLQGDLSALLSFNCKDWDIPNIDIGLTTDTSYITTSIGNYLDEKQLLENIEAFSKKITTWKELEDVCRSKYKNLTFLENSFSTLHKYPFSNSVVHMTCELLTTLDVMKTCFSIDGARTDRGNELYQDHFTGEKAWFSDSSETEKTKFSTELTFKDPDGHELFCPWHGKIKTPQFRIHFSWPISADRALYVAYVGPKLTKQ